MSGPTADEIARWAAEHHGWTPEDYPDSGEFCVECGEYMPCPTTRLLALVAAQAEELRALHATDDYQRWARAVAERDAARDELRAAGVRFEKALHEKDAQLQKALAQRREVVARVRELCDDVDERGGDYWTAPVRGAIAPFYDGPPR